MLYANKTVVVTGGNSGIGLATAARFIKEGARVAILGRDGKTLDAAAATLGEMALVLQTDVASPEALEQAANRVYATLGKIDVLFVNAGIAEFLPMEHVTEAFFDKTFDINVKGAFFTVQKFLPHMQDGGSVLLTTSVVNQKGWANTGIYSASKAAVRSLARTLAAELRPRNIRVNAISPGPIDTPIFGRLGMPQDQVQQMVAGMVAQSPMHRFGTADEVAQVALFLAGEQASYLTGQEIAVDGGLGQL